MKSEIIVDKIVTGPFQENTFVLRSAESGLTLIIDPGDDESQIINFIKSKNLKPLAILNTHAHLDHIGAVSILQELFSIPFYLHKDEKMILDQYEESCKLFELPPKEKPKVDVWLSNDKKITFKDFTIKIINTPGHTPGGVCYEVGKHVFVGDTLFKGSVGRTDLPGGNWDNLRNSLSHLVNTVNHEKIIHSGHGEDTKLKHELMSNPFLTSI